ncbi:hypothetical protein HRR83_002163 [Exophiala dermatitidis]|uniref:Uncharacterized protein n=1 Tax=Exophiala dermatitidis TaxID=5970 RepID=A0AAN6IZY5_EXODE|nr:hypothetical protein HRR74_002240 [Exophiala dermatitidis]KAJ4525684.1 hypothetical protein HRR73_002416 [Exophiala dermatitidis]KAJ4537008.1 hypothetical protein HRR76_005028 [Exophiala dermatitidis]KAJ4555394.1 hypothetical protein HRR77_001327 [Exophiala dermatitidis]KAJ4572292.1 hypothetical protein HRR79_003493 [Exophiala dermatitidis]
MQVEDWVRCEGKLGRGVYQVSVAHKDTGLGPTVTGRAWSKHDPLQRYQGLWSAVLDEWTEFIAARTQDQQFDRMRSDQEPSHELKRQHKQLRQTRTGGRHWGFSIRNGYLLFSNMLVRWQSMLNFKSAMIRKRYVPQSECRTYDGLKGSRAYSPTSGLMRSREDMDRQLGMTEFC